VRENKGHFWGRSERNRRPCISGTRAAKRCDGSHWTCW